VPSLECECVYKLDLDIVVCAKDRAETLQSLLPQILREIPFRNLIVIYGSSKDRTKEVAEEYTAKVFWDGDKGLGAARRLLLKTGLNDFFGISTILRSPQSSEPAYMVTDASLLSLTGATYGKRVVKTGVVTTRYFGVRWF
jgi:glycosyltransferase involved in cell wall biosynthesis